MHQGRRNKKKRWRRVQNGDVKNCKIKKGVQNGDFWTGLDWRRTQESFFVYLFDSSKAIIDLSREISSNIFSL
jgi:hypothetical protein